MTGFWASVEKPPLDYRALIISNGLAENKRAMLRTCFCLFAAVASVIAQDAPTANIDEVLDKRLAVHWQDDAIGHPDLIAFREYLKKAAREHNTRAVLEVADTTFEGCDMHGIDDLRTYLKGPWWSGFYKSLTEGGVLSPAGNSFDSNYAVWTFPALKVGVFGPEYFRVVRGANVPVFASPDPSSKSLGSVSYSLVVPEEPLVENGWQRVEFRRGQSGYIDSKYLIDPISESIRMRRINGRWRLVGIATYCD